MTTTLVLSPKQREALAYFATEPRANLFAAGTISSLGEMKRRRRGSGTIERTKDGRYRARFAFGGSPREDIEGSPFASHDDAERALDAILAELRDAGATRGGVTLRACAKRAFDLREKSGYASVQTDRERWDAYVKSHELADVPIRVITRGDIRDLLGSMKLKVGGPASTSTKKNTLNMLRMVFEVAVDDEHIDENILFGMKVKDAGTTTEAMYPLPWALAQALIAVATDPVVPIAIGCGMRSGQLRSLRWEDVHLLNELGVLLAKPHVLVRFGKPGKPNKNGKVHTVDLFGLALEAFLAMPRKAKGIVFPAKRGGYRAKARVVALKDWNAWLAAAGISRRVRFHDLRHTCATLLLNGDFGRKWSYEEVKELLDHSSVKVTERYAKVLGTLAASAAAEMRRGARKQREALAYFASAPSYRVTDEGRAALAAEGSK